MTKLSGHLKAHLRAWMGTSAITLGFMAWIACGPSAPFPDYDPPPTFAVYYNLESYGIYYPGGAGTGSVLVGSHVVDVVGTGNVTSGSTYSFGPAWVAFKTYYVVTGGRWPATWNIGSTGGCGAGTYDDVLIASKILNAVCTPRPAALAASPGSWDGNTPPSPLTLSFNTSEVPQGTDTDIYVLRTDGYVYSTESVTVDSNGEVEIYGASSLPGGDAYIAADLYSLPNGYEGAQTTVHVYCALGCN